VQEKEMKKIEALIKPFKLEDVKDALTETGITGMTATCVQGYGRQKGHNEFYRGAEYSVDFNPKMKLEIIVANEQADMAVSLIQRAAKTGRMGDGKIFVSAVESVTRIRSGEKDNNAF
jgi:nitrogen regulatory protein P-II 1